MNVPNLPAMSVILITREGFETLRKTLDGLRKQTVCSQLEIVIVASSREKLELDPIETNIFFDYQVIEAGEIKSYACAKAIGVRHCKAPLVAFMEDHVYPDHRWAEALIQAYRESKADVVGPAVGNANPKSAVSWANFLIEYNEWMHPAVSGAVSHLPGNNGSYRRGILLSYGDRLEAMLEAESILHWDLRAQGKKLYLESKAKIYHLNFSSPFSWMSLQFHVGRLFAGSRNRSLSPAVRLFYILGFPLIPGIRLIKILRQLNRPGRRKYLNAKIFFLLIIGLIMDGLGQGAGYLLGSGNSGEKITNYEFGRPQFLSEKDKKDSWNTPLFVSQ